MSDKDYLKRIGSRIKAIRERKGLTNMRLAFLTQMDVSAISEIQSGRKNSKILTLKKIATALEVDLSSLL